jgi:ketopantoate hydroxymethyltransferase
MNSGSVDSLYVCQRCGARTNARQIREIVDCDIPVAAAIDLVHQRVAFFGVFRAS